MRAFRAATPAAAGVADGLTTDIATRLAKFRYVRVIGTEPSAPAGGRHRYAIEGDLHESGSTIRTNVRLMDLASGAQIWAHHYDCDARLAAFDIVDPLADRIVATVADGHGELVRALAQDPDLASNLAIRFFAYIRHPTEEEHAQLRDACEAAVAAEPEFVEGWARLAVLYLQEALFNYNERPDAIQRARQASDRAMSLTPHHRPWFFVALFADAFMKGDADTAFDCAQRCAASQVPMPRLLTIAAAGRFGRADVAVRENEEWQRANNDQRFDLETARAQLQRGLWPSALFDAVFDGVKKAIELRASDR